MLGPWRQRERRLRRRHIYSGMPVASMAGQAPEGPTLAGTPERPLSAGLDAVATANKRPPRQPAAAADRDLLDSCFQFT